jgi:hypothetical protein
MIVFKVVDQYSRTSGEKAGSVKVFDHEICDFTGQKINKDENPNAYQVDHCDNDPCFGDGEGERWYDGDFYWELFSQSWYKFKIMSEKWEGYEVFGEMMKLALTELDEIYSLDHLLRWSRGRMLEKVIKSGQYKIEQFLKED